MNALQKHFPWITSQEEKDWLRAELLRRAAVGFEQVKYWREAAECWAEIGEYHQAGKLYQRSGDLGRAAAAELDAGRYAEACELYQAWADKLAAMDDLNQVEALLGQAACHVLGARQASLVFSRVAAQPLYRQALRLLEAEAERDRWTTARCWAALGRYGSRVGRYDLVQEGYEQALAYAQEITLEREWLEIGRAYLEAARAWDDRLLSRALEERLIEQSALPDEDSQAGAFSEPLEMVELAGGTFLMGSPDTDEEAYPEEKPQHLVTVSDFAIGRYLVTRGLYREITGTGRSEWEEDEDDDLLPANNVNWFDAVAFCNALSERQGLQICYRIDGEQVEWDRTANGYRLPTEAEWEYAVWAGTQTKRFFGDDATELDRYAWFDENSADKLHSVGEKQPNPWGLHDMLGNVYEWCWDWFDENYYAVSSADNSVGPDSSDYRVLRGGAFFFGAEDLRSAFRDRVMARFRFRYFGFRCVRGPRRQLGL